MASVSSVFVVKSVEFESQDSSKSSIFRDVEEAKARLGAMRRAAKRRLEATQAARPYDLSSGSTSSSESKPLAAVSLIWRSLLEAETTLSEVRATRTALESRKSDIEDLMKEIRGQIRNLPLLPVIPEPVVCPAEVRSSKTTAPKKKQRYFETAVQAEERQSSAGSADEQRSDAVMDDLSSVVCPFELLGRCTDPSCPHMHLSR